MSYTTNYDPNLAYPTVDSASSLDPAATAALAGVVLLFLIIFALVSYAVVAFLLSRIFKKAGVKEWTAWVPVYNTWKFLEIGGQQGFWAVLALIPLLGIVSTVFIYIAMFNIGKKLGKEDWFVLIAIFLPLVWMIWLAFDDSKWQGSKPVMAESTDDAKPAKKVVKKVVKKTTKKATK